MLSIPRLNFGIRGHPKSIIIHSSLSTEQLLFLKHHSEKAASNAMSEVLLRTRRAPTACSWCRYRKVRCDASILGCPCTRCRQDGRSNCVLRPHFRQFVYPVVFLFQRMLTVATKEGSPRHFPARFDYPAQTMQDNKRIRTHSLAQIHLTIETQVW